jgi:integrase
MRTSRRAPPKSIDRLIPGVGRITIRARRLSTDARADLDRAITRASQAGHLEQLRLLKNRSVSPKAFLAATRDGRVLALKPDHPLMPLYEKWLASSDIRETSRERYRQSWEFIFKSLPGSPTLAGLTGERWDEFLEWRRKEVGNATLNRDRAAYVCFRNWAIEKGYNVPAFKVGQRFKEEPEQSAILTPTQIGILRERCPTSRWPFFWALLGTGARQGEILNLERRDVSMVPAIVVVRSQPGSKARGQTRSNPSPPT